MHLQGAYVWALVYGMPTDTLPIEGGVLFFLLNIKKEYRTRNTHKHNKGITTMVENK